MSKTFDKKAKNVNMLLTKSKKAKSRPVVRTDSSINTLFSASNSELIWKFIALAALRLTPSLKRLFSFLKVNTTPFLMYLLDSHHQSARKIWVDISFPTTQF